MNIVEELKNICLEYGDDVEYKDGEILTLIHNKYASDLKKKMKNRRSMLISMKKKKFYVLMRFSLP